MATNDPLIQTGEGAAGRRVVLGSNEVEKGAKTDSYLIAMSGRRDFIPPSRQQAAPTLASVPQKAGRPLSPTAKATPPNAETIICVKNNEPVQFVQPSSPHEPAGQIGLTKEELEQYRNDPFWKKLRIFLFVLFWLLWIVMFLAAILIVIFSPKCAPKYEPKWWQNQVCYQTWLPSFQDAAENADGLGDLIGMTDRLNKLRKLGLSSIWPTPLLTSLHGNGVDITNFMKVEPRYGTNADFALLTERARDLDMRTIIDMPLTTTSFTHEWFKASAKKDPGFENAYVWSNAGPNDQYWTKEDKSRGQYYLHLDGTIDTPILNWDDNVTFARLTAVMKFYLDEPYKVDGFHLTNLEYVARTADGSAPDWPKILEHVAKLRKFIEDYKNMTGNDERDIVLFSSSGDDTAPADKLVSNVTFNYIIDTSLRAAIDECQGGEGSNASTPYGGCLHAAVDANMPSYEEGTTPTHLWQLGGPFVKRLASQFGSPGQSELALVLQLLLPGASSVYYGDPLGMEDIPEEQPILEHWKPQCGAMQWSAEANAGFTVSSETKAPVHPSYKDVNFEAQYDVASSPVKVFRKLSSLRLRDETLMMGAFVLGDNTDTTKSLLTFARMQTDNGTVKQGAEIYVGALNFGADAVNVDFQKTLLPASYKAGEVVTGTSTINMELYKPRQKFARKDGLTLAGGQGIVIKFKPE